MPKKKSRLQRLRKVRPCRCCGWQGRHYLQTKDPTLCLGCQRLPTELRNELKKKYLEKIDFELYCQKFLKNKRTRKQIARSIAPIALPSYSWPGAYTIVYWLGGDSYCGNCIQKVLRECHFGEHDEVFRRPYQEGPALTCNECGKAIESDYGELENDSKK